ncbi:hypothetical protein [Mesoterricola silvestris]|uniref:Uncharacterized protein n=1 Tax=Mesoterricola silvestris TaxID=2927979 RepID=A0AA48GSC3_9BACT|nr:hypothetical protein [Mesoterricola silvestris]BDU73365.1 hypothetical protein METEAL_25390 [Mesoterricola silvestris]
MRGGAALLLVLGILTLCAAVAWMAHRAVLREQAVEGEALQGARAALAADSALAWFLEEGWRDVPALLDSGDGRGREEVLGVPARVLPREPAQSGEVRVRDLGPSSRWPGSRVWRLTVVGRVTGPRPFVQTREVYVSVAEGRGPPIKRAWRIVR